MSTGEPIYTTVMPTSTGNGSTATSASSIFTISPTNYTYTYNTPYASTDDINKLNERLDKLEQHLLTFKVDQLLMEKYPALKEAYESYKLIEALVKDGKHDNR